MKVAIIGTRGIPAKYGGFETFAQEVSTRLVERGFDVTVVCPPGKEMPKEYNGVKLAYTKNTKDKNPLGYYLESVRWTVKEGFDVVLTCGQGGYAYIPHIFTSKTKKPVFITNTDGIEHRRTKWNLLVRLAVVRILSEWNSVIFSHKLVADSKGIEDYLNKEYWWVPNKDITVIEYGAQVLDPDSFPESLIEVYGLKHEGYHLVVSRLEPENNVSMIIEGYKNAKTDKPLIVVGNLNGNKYVKSLLDSAKGYDIRFLGGVYEPDKLKALRIHAASYLHGHSVGGTNPSLLEALGAANIVIGHDNPFNREVTDNKSFYFSNPQECSEAIEIVERLDDAKKKELKDGAVNRIKSYYNWNRIADEYVKLFNNTKR